MLWTKRGAGYVKLIPSCDISTLWLYDDIVIIYVAIMLLWTDIELRNLFLQKITFTEKSDFLRKFYTTKIWSHTIVVCIHVWSVYITKLAAVHKASNDATCILEWPVVDNFTHS